MVNILYKGQRQLLAQSRPNDLINSSACDVPIFIKHHHDLDTVQLHLDCGHYAHCYVTVPVCLPDEGRRGGGGGGGEGGGKTNHCVVSKVMPRSSSRYQGVRLNFS